MIHNKLDTYGRKRLFVRIQIAGLLPPMIYASSLTPTLSVFTRKNIQEDLRFLIKFGTFFKTKLDN